MGCDSEFPLLSRDQLNLTELMSLVYGPFLSRAQAKEQGLKQYYVGHCCPRNHVAPHMVAGGCSVCAREYSRNWQREARRQNPEKYKNKERTRVRFRTDELRAKEAARRKAAGDRLRLYRRQYMAKRRTTDPQYRLRSALQARISAALKKGYGVKAKKTIELLGCSVEYLVLHMEKQFKPGMSWDNYGRNGWHVDHIIPCTAFNLEDPEEQKRCFYYANLQPLWEVDNIRKSNKILNK